MFYSRLFLCAVLLICLSFLVYGGLAYANRLGETLRSRSMVKAN